MYDVPHVDVDVDEGEEGDADVDVEVEAERGIRWKTDMDELVVLHSFFLLPFFYLEKGT